MESEPLLELEGATIGTQDGRGRWATGVNWTVRRGDYWVVGGASEAGVLELLMTGAGLLPAREGRCRLFGEDVGALAQSEWRAMKPRVGMVFGRGGRLFEELTLLENVALPILYHRECEVPEAAAEAQDWLDAIGAGGLARRYPREVTMSWRQRVALARALVLRPELLFVEDPLLAVEFRHFRWWLSFMGTLSSGHPLAGGQGITLIVSADHMAPWVNEARLFACWAGDGRWVVVGDRSALKGSADPAVREFLESEPAGPGAGGQGR